MSTEYLNQINKEVLINTIQTKSYVQKVHGVFDKLGKSITHYSQKLGPKISLVHGGPTGTQVIYEPGIFSRRRRIRPL